MTNQRQTTIKHNMHKMYSGSAQRPTSILKKLTTELNNFIKINNLTIKAKINKNHNLLAKQATPNVSDGCGLWSTLPVSPAEELWVHTTDVSDVNADSPGVSDGRGLNNLIKS